jgi:hypothetical protein
MILRSYPTFVQSNANFAVAHNAVAALQWGRNTKKSLPNKGGTSGAYVSGTHSKRTRRLNSERQKLETELALINRELGALDAYEAAKTGKPKSSPRRCSWFGAKERQQAQRHHGGAC